MLASRRSRIVAAAVVIALLGGAVAGLRVLRERRSRVTVQTERTGRRDLVSTVSASGEIKPKRYVDISANVSGRITNIYVKEGERVTAGQILCRIDSTQFAAEKRQAEAAVLAAQADLTRAMADLDVSRLDHERVKKMHHEQLVSDQALDQAAAKFEMAKANVASLQGRIAQLKAVLESSADNLAKTTIPSPMDGVVTSLVKEEGEVVIGALSFQPTVIMTVADLSVMEAEVLADETDIRNLSLGQEAKVRVDALQRLEIKGEVTEIGSSAIPRGGTTAQAGSSSTNTGNQAKDFKVVVTLENPPSDLRPGLNATADIVTARKTHVVAVPIQSVVVREVDKDGRTIDPAAVQASDAEPNAAPVRRAGEERDGVFVVSKDEVVFWPVKTGILGETDIEIVDGLKEGEEVVTGSYKTLRTLKDRARVKIEKPEKKEKT
jgi:HlyD family secretion protein